MNLANKSTNLKLEKTKMRYSARTALIVFGLILGFYSIMAFADTNKSIADIAKNIMDSFKQLGQLMLAMAYLSGFGFVISSIFKFKQHKDNPTQIPVSTPIALLMVGIVLIFLPGILRPAGYTIFGTGAQLEQLAGGFKGEGAESIPGSQ
jgi:intracellular multiplication protein IcmD